jgi:hypothetical protein
LFLLTGLAEESLKNNPSHGLSTAEIAAFVQRYDSKPRKKRSVQIISRKAIPRGQETVLKHIVGVVGVSDITPDELKDCISVSFDENIECTSFPGFGASG